MHCAQVEHCDLSADAARGGVCGFRMVVRGRLARHRLRAAHPGHRQCASRPPCNRHCALAVGTERTYADGGGGTGGIVLLMPHAWLIHLLADTSLFGPPPSHTHTHPHTHPRAFASRSNAPATSCAWSSQCKSRRLSAWSTRVASAPARPRHTHSLIAHSVPVCFHCSCTADHFHSQCTALGPGAASTRTHMDLSRSRRRRGLQVSQCRCFPSAAPPSHCE